MLCKREKVLQCKCIVSMLGSSTQVTDPQNLNSRKSFHFDHCYWSHDEYTENEQGVHVSGGHHSRYADQAKVFNDLGRTILENVWRGFNATLFAYGQTGSGKSYTMTGYGQNKGLVSMICEELFRGIREKQSPERQFHVYFSMFEIYNEQVLTKEHCLKQSEIDLVDLAGSEKQRSSGSTSDRFNEARAINLSLTTLGNVIRQILQLEVGRLRGITSVGRIPSSEEDIVMKGLGILDKHAVLVNCDDKVTMEPQKGARILVNGVPLLTRSQLKHLDRIIFGSCVFYLYMGFPQERSEKDKIHKYGKDFFLSEIASDREFAQLHLGVSDKQKENIDPNLTRVFHDFTALVPVVMQANQISQELGKDSGNDFSELRERLLHLELECDKLREENQVLKTENFEMRGEMEERARQGPIPDNTSISEKLSNDRLRGRSAFLNFDAEFAKALKRFCFGMNGVKGKLNHLKEIRPLTSVFAKGTPFKTSLNESAGEKVFDSTEVYCPIVSEEAKAVINKVFDSTEVYCPIVSEEAKAIINLQ
ncbi:UNVERIFIED_CONTAM: hypothetical protein FKN15_077220 [Acipenser sinensis]